MNKIEYGNPLVTVCKEHADRLKSTGPVSVITPSEVRINGRNESLEFCFIQDCGKPMADYRVLRIAFDALTEESDENP